MTIEAQHRTPEAEPDRTRRACGQCKLVRALLPSSAFGVDQPLEDHAFAITRP